MRNQKTGLYCNTTPTYPIKGYMTFLELRTAEYYVHYPLDIIQTDIETVCSQVTLLSQQLHRDIALDETATIVPITLKNLFPLHRGYWENEHIHYDQTDRIQLFKQALTFHHWYQLIVTPATHEDSTFFSVAIPTPISGGKTIIEQFMRLSDFPVDHTASCAGIYIMDHPFSLNWQTKQIDTRPYFAQKSGRN